MTALISKINAMSVTDEEFEDLYQFVCEKYWNTKPAVNDDYFQSARFLNLLSNRDVPELIIATATIAQEVFKVIEQKIPALAGELHVGDNKLFFKIATDKDAVDNLHKMLANAAIVKSKEEN